MQPLEAFHARPVAADLSRRPAPRSVRFALEVPLQTEGRLHALPVPRVLTAAVVSVSLAQLELIQPLVRPVAHPVNLGTRVMLVRLLVPLVPLENLLLFLEQARARIAPQVITRRPGLWTALLVR